MRFSILSILTATVIIALVLNGVRMRNRSELLRKRAEQLSLYSSNNSGRLTQFASQQLLYERFLDAESVRRKQLGDAQLAFQKFAESISQFTKPHTSPIELLSIPTYDTPGDITRRFRIYSDSANEIFLLAGTVNGDNGSHDTSTLFDPAPQRSYPLPNGENIIAIKYSKKGAVISVKINDSIVFESKLRVPTSGVSTSTIHLVDCHQTDLSNPLRLFEIQPNEYKQALQLILSRSPQ